MFSNKEAANFQHSVNKIELHVMEKKTLTLREERGLTVFENRVLRSIFG
jgi:hypothetical protein